MVVNDAMQDMPVALPSLAGAMANAPPIGMVEPIDVSNAVAFLVFDEARHITGITMPLNAGFTNKK
jgi:NAD(P)-dependent dehydrogenase (short-subunit alcohol dehydrogenase family)